MPKINIIQLGTQGVDMKSSPLLVGAKNRVHSATNLVFDEGVVRTRPGFVYATTGAVGQFNGAASFRPRRGISSAPLSQALSGIAVVVDGVPILGCHPLGDTFGCCGDVHIFQAENYLIFQSPECDTFWWDGMTLTRSPGMNEVDWVEDEVPFKELEHETPIANIPDCESLGNETEVVVTFTVLDGTTSLPVEGAIINVFHNTHKAFFGITGEDGKWVFHPTPREYQYTITRDGYVPQEDGSFVVNAEASERIWDVCAPPQILINGETDVLVRLAPIICADCISLEIGGINYTPEYNGGKTTEGVLTELYLTSPNYSEITNPEGPWEVLSTPPGDVQYQGEISFGVACSSSVDVTFSLEVYNSICLIDVFIYLDGVYVGSVGLTHWEETPELNILSQSVNIGVTNCSVITFASIRLDAPDAPLGEIARVTIDAINP